MEQKTNPKNAQNDLEMLQILEFRTHEYLEYENKNEELKGLPHQKLSSVCCKAGFPRHYGIDSIFVSARKK